MSRRNRREIYNQEQQPFIQGTSLQEASDALYGMIESIDLSPDALTINEDGAMQFKRFTLTKLSLMIPNDATPDELQEIGELLFRVNQSLQWWLGDYVCFLQNKDKENARRQKAGMEHDGFEWGNTYKRLALDFHYAEGSLHNMASVARNVNVSRRRETLSFGHHQVVMGLDDDDQAILLEDAERHNWSVSTLREKTNVFIKKRDSRRSGIKVHPYVDLFKKRYKSLDKWQKERLDDADPEEREIIANMLRRLADEIENTE